MKTQLAGLCLGERRFLQIRLHAHDDVRDRVGDYALKVYLRDRLVRCLRESFTTIPWFYIVIEDRDTFDTSDVRPHVHGSIEIPRAPLPKLVDGRVRAKYRRMAEREGIEEAEYVAGRQKIISALKKATGNHGGKNPVVNGRSQSNNVWKRKPYHPLFNLEWVSYALKNMNTISPKLPENRLSTSRGLTQEAQRLWALIREGETALRMWP